MLPICKGRGFQVFPMKQSLDKTGFSFMNRKINIFSFFSGAGFLDLGFEMEPCYQVVYINEFHQAFNDIYR